MPSDPATTAYRLTVPIAILLILAAGAGLAWTDLYRDNLLVTAGWRGNDLVTLCMAVPVLLVSSRLAQRGSDRARLVWLGALLYTLYGYAFYLFGAAFNALFLVYAAILTLSLIALVLGLAGLDTRALTARFDPATPLRGIAVWLVMLALALGGAHVAMTLGALATGRVPSVVAATGHPTNVVAALDLSLVVAPSILAARWLLRDDPWGPVLATLVNVKGAVYMTALTAATVAAARAGAPVDVRQAFLWAGVGFGCLLSAGALLGGLRGRAVAVPLALLVSIVAACGSGKTAADGAQRPADLVIRGPAYTMDAARSWAGAVAVRNGRIVWVGPDSVPAALIGPATEIVDARSGMVLPGFQDAHVHPISGGIELGECHLNELTTARAVVDSIRACARAAAALPWIRGGGWQLPLFPGANPSRVTLDSAVADRPAAFEAADGHSLWVNSRALGLAAITRDTPDPPGGRIERDPRTGDPSGTLRESAMHLVQRVLPARTEAELAAGLDRAQRLANGFGITTLFAATADEASLRTYAAADRAGRLSVRVVAAAYPDPDQPDSIVPRARAWRASHTTARVRPMAVKLFQDGVIEARTAAMLAAYLDRPGDAGTPSYDQPTLGRLTANLDREGFQIHVHAIGDRAIRMTLDAFEHARETNGPRDARHAITHLELIDPADIPRFRALGVVANFEALWANGDEYLTELTEPALGPARSRWLYPIASVVRSGAVVSGGSDWSVSSLNPLDAIEVGVTHRSPGDTSAASWNPLERVDLQTMLALYTINAAWAMHQDRETGSIEIGKLADLTVLDRNLFELPAERIHEARVVRTLLEGETVYLRE